MRVFFIKTFLPVSLKIITMTNDIKYIRIGRAAGQLSAFLHMCSTKRYRVFTLETL